MTTQTRGSAAGYKRVPVRVEIVDFHPSPAHMVNKEQAVSLGRELVQIEKKCGNLDNRTIWTQAKQAPGSSIYSFYQEKNAWNDKVAADRYRDDLARKLKQYIEVTIRTVEGKEIRAPLTIAIQSREEEVQHGNRTPMQIETVIHVMNSPNAEEKLAGMLEDAKAALSAWCERYECLKSISGLWHEVDAALRKHRGN